MEEKLWEEVLVISTVDDTTSTTTTKTIGDQAGEIGLK